MINVGNSSTVIICEIVQLSIAIISIYYILYFIYIQIYRYHNFHDNEFNINRLRYYKKKFKLYRFLF